MKATRTPPSNGRSIYSASIPVYAFEKNEGSIASTFIGRIIHRQPIHLTLRDGSIIDAVRYAGRYWPIYEAETFAETSRRWVKEGDAVYGDGHIKLKLPLRHSFLFDCDDPKGPYN